MIYEVRITQFFSVEDDAKDLIDKAQDLLEKSVVVHPDEPNQQGCSIELIMCFHDQTPTQPCISCGRIECPCP